MIHGEEPGFFMLLHLSVPNRLINLVVRRQCRNRGETVSLPEIVSIKHSCGDSRPGWFQRPRCIGPQPGPGIKLPKLVVRSPDHGVDQFHLAVSGAVQDHHLALGVAENEDIAVAEMGFFDGFFESHGAHGDSFIGANQVNLRGAGHRGITVYGDGYCRFFPSGLSRFARPRRAAGNARSTLHFFFALAGGALFRLPLRLVFHRLLLKMVQSLADGDHHIFGLGQADQRAIARVDRDFSFVAVLFDCEDHLGFESVAQTLRSLVRPVSTSLRTAAVTLQ